MASSTEPARNSDGNRDRRARASDPLPVLVVSLDRAPQRWEAVRAGLGALGIAPERVPAIDARACDPAILEAAYDARANAKRYFQPLKPTEIACFLSHRAAWSSIAQSGRAALVLEDDAGIAPDLMPWLDGAEARALLDGPRIVKLYAKRAGRGKEVARVEGGRVLRPILPPLGAVAQIIAPEAAAALLRASERNGQAWIFDPVDVFLQRWWDTRTDIFVADPAPISEISETLGGTTLSRTEPEDRAGKFARELRRPVFRALLWATARNRMRSGHVRTVQAISRK